MEVYIYDHKKSQLYIDTVYHHSLRGYKTAKGQSLRFEKIGSLVKGGFRISPKISHFVRFYCIICFDGKYLSMISMPLLLILPLSSIYPYPHSKDGLWLCFLSLGTFTGFAGTFQAYIFLLMHNFVFHLINEQQVPR